MTDQIQVLDHGFVRLDAALADDLSVVNSARVSYGERHEQIEAGDEALINFLLRERHGSPFEHNMFRFHVKAPIFIFREWMRHRIGSFNEMSGRYTKLSAHWYIPRDTDVRVRVGKPGRYTYEPATRSDAFRYIDDLQVECNASYQKYCHHLDKGIAPEVARNFLHVNHYSEMYWTINARSLMNFLNLRNAPTAQYEIQLYAIEVEKVFVQFMPITHKAFTDNDRIAP